MPLTLLKKKKKKTDEDDRLVNPQKDTWGLTFIVMSSSSFFSLLLVNKSYRIDTLFFGIGEHYVAFHCCCLSVTVLVGLKTTNAGNSFLLFFILFFISLYSGTTTVVTYCTLHFLSIHCLSSYVTWLARCLQIQSLMNVFKLERTMMHHMYMI